MTEQTPVIQLTLGVNAPALSIPGVAQVRGILIDNPSGAWLLLRTTGDYIAPYTIGFARSFDTGHASVAIEFPSSGPAGQVTTLAGDRPRVILSSEPVGNSSGASAEGRSFVEQFTPVLTASVGQTVPTSTGIQNQTAIAAVANRRIRILNIVACLFPFSSSVIPDSSGNLQLFASGGNPNFNINLTPEIVNIPGPIDVPVGQGMLWSFFPEWKDLWVQFSIMYNLI